MTTFKTTEPRCRTCGRLLNVEWTDATEEVHEDLCKYLGEAAINVAGSQPLLGTRLREAKHMLTLLANMVRP